MRSLLQAEHKGSNSRRALQVRPISSRIAIYPGRTGRRLCARTRQQLTFTAGRAHGLTRNRGPANKRIDPDLFTARATSRFMTTNIDGIDIHAHAVPKLFLEEVKR